MRIATFNIWNNQTLWGERLAAICEVIKNVNPEVLAIQEVRSTIDGEKGINVAQYIANQTGYPFCIFKEYPDSPDEGLAFLSKVPICTEDVIWNKNTKESNYCAIRITFKYGNYEFGITNVHLNWKSTFIRNEQIRAVHDWIFTENKARTCEILCGDFNDDPYSSIHQYLTDNQWIDVAQFKEEHNDIKPQPTLDFINNLNIKNESSLKLQARYDWILINKNNKLNISSIDNVEVFGDYPVTKEAILPSDHYGVLMDIT
ncbi:Metal-dependent hydrolase, endonuclease/exonuclease/phosphatase family [Bacillus sp. 491mf]|uniref:endonuclease/exonuclease/phosphatase family protein n=1 Tax=Bacillus sp. 491mf TaxID=1761755 RepID=UPI0008DEE2ED|nr:endonuclease/exonuclease/phosphatase family protein [Bacillus sp. 491mf]SFC36024.1 Metal-dependent hydrolase, endonuclease/exonuclease/phosphatase family [Bacillus sp. 491mf]